MKGGVERDETVLPEERETVRNGEEEKVNVNWMNKKKKILPEWGEGRCVCVYTHMHKKLSGKAFMYNLFLWVNMLILIWKRKKPGTNDR